MGASQRHRACLDSNGGLVNAMADHPVFINGEMVSANRLRERQRIEHGLAELERDLVILQGEIEREADAQSERRQNGR